MGYLIQPVVTTSPNNKLGVASSYNQPGVFNSITNSVTQGGENLKNLLLTRIGERYNQPTFGCNLSNIIFEPITEFIKQDIYDDIINAVSTWLPYVAIDEIVIKTVQDDPGLEYYIHVQITATINNIQLDPIIVYATESGQLIVE